MADFVVQYTIAAMWHTYVNFPYRNVWNRGNESLILHRDNLQSNEVATVRQCTAEEDDHLVELLEQIAAELSWQPGEQLRKYQAQAVHFAAYVDGNLAGGLQLVPASLSETLPCELVWPDVCLSRRTETAHISVLALRREYRGSAGLLWPLCVAMWRYCALHQIKDISLEVTPKTYQLYTRLGWPLEIIGDLRQHWGEDYCYLCRMGTAEVAGAMLMKAPRSGLYREIVGLMSQPAH